MSALTADEIEEIRAAATDPDNGLAIHWWARVALTLLADAEWHRAEVERLTAENAAHREILAGSWHRRYTEALDEVERLREALRVEIATVAVYRFGDEGPQAAADWANARLAAILGSET